MSLPLASNRERTWRGIGVLTGPYDWLSQLWAVVRGSTIKVAGHAVNAKVAVDRLAEIDPQGGCVVAGTHATDAYLASLFRLRLAFLRTRADAGALTASA